MDWGFSQYYGYSGMQIVLLYSAITYINTNNVNKTEHEWLWCHNSLYGNLLKCQYYFCYIPYITRQSEMADLARRATSVCTKFHRDRLRNGWDITLWNFAKTRTNTDRQTDMGITIPRPPPMGGEVTRIGVFAQGQILCISPNGLHGINWLWYTIYLTFDKMLH